MGLRETLSVGVIGVGYLGQHHARVFSELPHVRLAGLFDTDLRRAQEIGTRLKVPVFDGLEELVDRVDALSIVTPTVTHADLVLRVLARKRIPLFLEKPIADSVVSATRILSAVREAKTLLQVGHIERFNPGVVAMLESGVRPAYIEAQRLSPFGLRANDVPVVVDLMIHDIDIILALVRSKIQTMRVVGTPAITPHIDLANAWIEFENGCLAQVTASRVSLEKLRKIRVFDRRGLYFSLNYDTRELSQASVRLDPGALPEISRTKRTFEAEEPLKRELGTFVTSVREGLPPHVSGEEAFQALEVALEVNRLAEESLLRFRDLKESDPLP
ncbi:MAG: Gfo/Idh/MocA family oxidoreductase [Nitrospirae bacterium]|nr:Gfo/Idh/MocA family oxidoreductase [Nitrospirota bacterium]MCL5285894.1 Gfo/Idh/MocA family oxidoreductase [Nitrospirota bacterium]